MPRPPDFDLGTALASPSFTPAQRDAPALVDLVVAGDSPSADRAATALAGLGETGRRALDLRLASDPRPSDREEPELGEAATARLVAALGLLARRGDAAAHSALLARVDDRFVRVRRAAIVALGKLGGDGARAALLARWDASEIAPDERRALAEALGKLGGAEALARLRALDPGTDDELARRRDRALLIADRTAQRDAVSEIAVDVDPPAPITVRLRCKPGLASLLVEELAARGFAPRPAQPGVRPDVLPAKTGSEPISDDAAELTLDRAWSALFVSRLWASAAIQIACPPRGSGDEAEAIVDALTAAPVRALLRAWTRGPIRWRLGFPRGHRRAVVWRVAKLVGARAPELINDPTQTTWDVIAGDDALELVPRRAPDPRFAWRVADIAAASHPTVAAALAYVARAQPGDRIWDPFAGSASELVERARLGGYASLLATDIDDTALAAARQNLDAANLAATLVNADARSYHAGPVDLIITNPPLGRRVRLDAAALLVAALPNLVRALAPAGRLVWITPAPRKTSPIAEQLGLRRTRALAVDLGGVRGQLERWERETGIR